MARLHLKCSKNVSGGKGLSKLNQSFQCIHNVITGFPRPLPPVSADVSIHTNGERVTEVSPVEISKSLLICQMLLCMTDNLVVGWVVGGWHLTGECCDGTMGDMRVSVNDIRHV